MKIRDVIGILKKNALYLSDFNCDNHLEIEINSVAIHTNNTINGSLFVCRKGYKFDSHSLITEAHNSGAVAFIVERGIDLDIEVPTIQVSDSRTAESLISSALFGTPHEKVKMYGVTGTNGKTTVSTMIHYILSRFGEKGSLMGTVENIIVDRSSEAYNTTPSAVEINENIDETYRKNGTFVSMEVSSHALSLKRVESIRYDYAVLTNITQDHLDFHKTMDAYTLTKFHLIELLKKNGTAILNIDDKSIKEMIQDIPIDKKIVSYGIKNTQQMPDYAADNIECGVEGIEFDLYIRNKKTERVHCPLIGDFNVYNILAGIALLHREGYELKKILTYLKSFRGVPGRFELYSHVGNDIDLVVDFAHTPDALEKTLMNARKMARNRVIVVFGAGGDSDREKRPVMGGIAGEYSDVVIVTSDNPKSEMPFDIIKQIEDGINSETPYLLVEDRKLAIETAINLTNKGDLVVLAGKGHERFQLFEHTFLPFSDRDIAFQMLRTMKHSAS